MGLAYKTRWLECCRRRNKTEVIVFLSLSVIGQKVEYSKGVLNCEGMINELLIKLMLQCQ